MARYRCQVCSFIYNETLGNPEGGIAPRTAWDSVPAEWVCPVCKAGKGSFVHLDGSPFIIPGSDLDPTTYPPSMMGLLFSNLAHEAAALQLADESQAFRRLSEHYLTHDSNFMNVTDDSTAQLLDIVDAGEKPQGFPQDALDLLKERLTKGG